MSALDDPRRRLDWLVKRAVIDEPRDWEGIQIIRKTACQFLLIGYGYRHKIGTGKMSVATAMTLVADAAWKMHEQHERVQQPPVKAPDEPVYRIPPLPSITMKQPNRRKKAIAAAGQLPLWGVA